MANLELKIAPPILLLLTAAAMGGLAYWGVVPLPIPHGWRVIIASPLFLASFILLALSSNLFSRMGTTRKPQRPEKASVLVMAGVYRYSRNPMYLAASTLLLALGFVFGDLLALLLAPCFALYLTRFQIMPEERALERLFGEAYREYKRRVRRWI